MKDSFADQDGRGLQEYSTLSMNIAFLLIDRIEKTSCVCKTARSFNVMICAVLLCTVQRPFMVWFLPFIETKSSLLEYFNCIVCFN